MPACIKLHELLSNCPDSRPAPFTSARVFRWWGDFPQAIRPGSRPSSLAREYVIWIEYKDGDEVFVFFNFGAMINFELLHAYTWKFLQITTENLD